MDCDVAVIGAGVAGLTAARQLQNAGYRVTVLEKSRGVAGRLATHRLPDTRVDRGCPALQVQGDRTRALLDRLQTEGIVRPWYDDADGTTHFAAPAGISAVGKWLAAGLDVRKQCLVTELDWDEVTCWKAIYADGAETSAGDNSANNGAIAARALLLAIPSPQLVSLLEASWPVQGTLIAAARAASYHSQVTVVAGYDPTQIPDRTPDRPAIAPDHPVVARIVRDSSKRDPGDRGASVIFVIHSTYDFARQQLDLPADSLEPAARALLDAAGEVIPTFAAPQWHQVRRWRYAIPDRAHWETHLEMDADRPLACAGDWCGGNRVESALESGAAAAEAIARFLA